MMLEEAKQAAGDESEATVIALQALSGVLLAQGDLPGAKAQLEAALAMLHTLYGGDKPHHRIATTLHELGVVLRAQCAFPRRKGTARGRARDEIQTVRRRQATPRHCLHSARS